MGKNNSKHQKQVDGENIPQTNGTEGGNTVVKQKPKKANKKLTPHELEELENCTYCKSLRYMVLRKILKYTC